MTTQNLSYTDIDHEFTGEAILIAGLEAELERLTAYVKAADEKIARQDAAIRELEGGLCEARAEVERLQNLVHEMAVALETCDSLNRSKLNFGEESRFQQIVNDLLIRADWRKATEATND